MGPIDVSKHPYEVLIGVPDKKRRRRTTLMNRLEDFQRLSTALVGYDLPVLIGFEATGNYYSPLDLRQRRLSSEHGYTVVFGTYQLPSILGRNKILSAFKFLNADYYWSRSK